MNRHVIFYCCMLLLIGATASAQDLSFELDDYAAYKYGRNPPTGYLWPGNPNVRVETVQKRDSRGAVHTEPTGCVFVPGRLNTAKGDAVLSAAPGSIIYGLLTSLGQAHSHSGMARSSSSIRHNTLEEGSLDTVDSGGVPQYAKPTGSHSLRDGWPGLTTQTVEAATSWQEFNIANGLVLYSYSPTAFSDSAVQTSRRATQRSDAAANMEEMRGYYRLYAYTNMTWDDPFTLSGDDGSMCSGSVYYAHATAGNAYWTPSAWVAYPADVRNGAASTLYSTIKGHIKNSSDWLSDFLLFVNAGFGGTSRDDIATRVANQVVNCMAFDDCGNRTTRWKNGVGSGKTMSPDDLYNYAFAAAYASALTGADNGFVYNGAKPLEVTHNYYCCSDTDGRGVKSTTCQYQ